MLKNCLPTIVSFSVKSSALPVQNVSGSLLLGRPAKTFAFAGFSGGLLGLCGPQSSLFFYVHLAIWYLQENYPAGYVRFLVENAGSMQIIHKRAIKEILNIQQCTDDQLRWDSANYFGIKTRAIYHRVSDEIRIKAVQEHRGDIVQQSVGNDPMPDVTISQLPTLVKDQVPIISAQSTFPIPATKQMIQDLLKPKNVCGPFSAAAKIVVQKYQYPVNILEQTFFGSGCFRADEIVDFFFGHNASQHMSDADKARYNTLRTLQDRFTHTGQGLERLLIEIMQNVVRKGVQVQIVFIVDLQAQTIFKRIGVKCPQWATYCIWDPVKKYFYIDTAAWSAYGPIPRNWSDLPELMYVPVTYESRSFSVSFPIVHDGIHKCQILLSGQGTAFVSKYCPLCNREADTGLACTVHSKQSGASLSLRAIAIVDNDLNFRVVQSELADRDNHAPCWRVLVVSSNFEQQLNKLVEPSFQFPNSPVNICLGTADTGISLRYHVSRFRNFDEIWKIFCAGNDHYIDEWNEPVVAHIWNFASYHDL